MSFSKSSLFIALVALVAAAPVGAGGAMAAPLEPVATAYGAEPGALGTWAPPVDNAAADVRVVYAVEEVRSGRFTATVMLTNMTAQTIPGWTMSFRMDSRITEMDNAHWSQNASLVDVRGAGWNAHIAPGQVVWFRISAVLTSHEAETPRECFFNGVSCTVEAATVEADPVASASDMIVASWIGDQDQTTYTGHIFIRNPTPHPLPYWNLTFSTPSLISRMDHVAWSRSGSSYSVEGTAGTAIVPAGGFVFFSFEGVHDGEPTPPDTCAINGFTCQFVEPDMVVETPRMNVEFTVDEYTDGLFEGIVVVENPSNEDLDSWTLRFTMADPITHMEDVEWTRTGTDQYAVVGTNGKRRIRAGGSTYFIIRGFIQGVAFEPPDDCSVNGVFCLLKAKGFEVPEEEEEEDEDPPDDGGGGNPVTCASSSVTTVLPHIDFRFLSVTASRWVALIDITNVGNGVIRGWSLDFKLVDGMAVSRFWNGILTETAEGGYHVVNNESNECILPGEKAQFGFEGSHDGNFGEPIGCQFLDKICIFQRFSVGSEDQEELPAGGVALDAAYPNPFSGLAQVSFRSGRTQHVVVDMWDMLGRRVEVLFDQMVLGGESVSARIDGSSLAAGTYILRLAGQDGQTATHTVVLKR